MHSGHIAKKLQLSEAYEKKEGHSVEMICQGALFQLKHLFTDEVRFRVQADEQVRVGASDLMLIAWRPDMLLSFHSSNGDSIHPQ